MRASLGLTYCDHLADPVANHEGVNIATKAENDFLFLLTAQEANPLGTLKIANG